MSASKSVLCAALLAASACHPPEQTASEVRTSQRFARLGSARLQGVVVNESSVGEVIMLRSDDEDSDTRSFDLKDGSGSVRITYSTANADGPLADGERVGADIDLTLPLQLGTPTIDQESVAVARKVWQLPEATP